MTTTNLPLDLTKPVYMVREDTREFLTFDDLKNVSVSAPYKNVREVLVVQYAYKTSQHKQGHILFHSFDLGTTFTYDGRGIVTNDKEEAINRFIEVLHADGPNHQILS